MPINRTGETPVPPSQPQVAPELQETPATRRAVIQPTRQPAPVDQRDSSGAAPKALPLGMVQEQGPSENADLRACLELFASLAPEPLGEKPALAEALALSLPTLEEGVVELPYSVAEMTQIVSTAIEIQSGNLQLPPALARDILDTALLLERHLGGAQSLLMQRNSAPLGSTLSPTQQAALKRMQETTRSVFQQVSAPDTSVEVILPSPQLVQLEQAFSGDFANFAGGDIEQLVELVMMQCQQETDVELREMLAEMKAVNGKKKQMRDWIATTKAESARAEAELRQRYDERCALPAGDNRRIIPSETSFEDFKQSQQLSLLAGDLASDDEPPSGDLEVTISPNETYYPQGETAVTTASGQPVPQWLVDIATMTQTAPEQALALKQSWDAMSPAERLRFNSDFATWLVAPPSDGGVGLTTAPHGPQDSAVDAYFLAHPPPVTPPGSTTPPVSVDLALVASQYGISAGEARALQDYYNLLPASSRPATFDAFLVASAPSGPALATGLGSQSFKVEDFFAQAVAPASPDDPYAYIQSVVDFATLPAEVRANVEAAMANHDLALVMRTLCNPTWERAGGAGNNANDVGSASYLNQAQIDALYASFNDTLPATVRDTFDFLIEDMCAEVLRDEHAQSEGINSYDDRVTECQTALTTQLAALPPEQRAAMTLYIQLHVAEFSGMLSWSNELYNEVNADTSFNDANRSLHDIVGGDAAGGQEADVAIFAPSFDWQVNNAYDGSGGDENADVIYADAGALAPTQQALSEFLEQLPPVDAAVDDPNAADRLSIATLFGAGGYDDTPPPPGPGTLPAVVLSEKAAAAAEALRAGIDHTPVQPGQVAGVNEVTLAEMEATIEAWEGKKESLNELSEEVSLKLQMLTERRQKYFQVISNIMKKASDTTAGIIGNMK